MTVAVEAKQHRTRICAFDLSALTPGRLAELAKHANPPASSSVMLQVLLTFAYDAIVLDQPTEHPFAHRVRQLAAQRVHAARQKRTSFNLDDEDMNGIRKLRDALQLPRQDLVVEYVVQAAWDTRSPTGGGGNDGEPEDPRDRKRRLARFHNVNRSRSHLQSLPLPDELALPFTVEEVSTKG